MSKLIEENLIGAIRSTGDTLLKCMMIVTAIEFCGSFLTGETGKNTTGENFKKFWRSDYMPKNYHDKGELLYEILRNGVSHSFIAKGGVIPSGERKSSARHLEFFKNGIFIYVPRLEEDVITGISTLLEDIKKNKNNLRQNYFSILEKIKKHGYDKYNEFTKENSIKVKDEIIAGDINPDLPYVEPFENYHTERVIGSAVGSTVIVGVGSIWVDSKEEKESIDKKVS